MAIVEILPSHREGYIVLCVNNNFDSYKKTKCKHDILKMLVPLYNNVFDMFRRLHILLYSLTQFSRTFSD